jgi:hypothetical protein
MTSSKIADKSTELGRLKATMQRMCAQVYKLNAKDVGVLLKALVEGALHNKVLHAVEVLLFTRLYSYSVTIFHTRVDGPKHPFGQLGSNNDSSEVCFQAPESSPW